MTRRIDPQPVTLDVRPVDLLEDRARVEALAAANGDDALRDRINRVATVAGLVVLIAFVVRCLTGCSPADWAAAQAAGGTIGAAVDTFALVRAEQIKAKSAEASKAAASGDTMGALRALSEAQALTSAKTFEELAEVRRELAAARAACPAAVAP
jgi:hypothetical protein